MEAFCHSLIACPLRWPGIDAAHQRPCFYSKIPVHFGLSASFSAGPNIASGGHLKVSKSEPTIIKKYANRRLYHTGTSTYVTLDDLAQMVKKGDDFTVVDAKTGEDITRSVLTQIIFEQEGKSGQNLLPVNFLRQLIGYYGDSMQALIPTYLEHSFKMLADNQQKFRDQFSSSFASGSFGKMDEQMQKNMAMFRDAMSLFTPFGLPAGKASAAQSEAEGSEPADGTSSNDELSSLKRELAEMQKKIDRLG
jgi:polyhydroxyalkanoate synthesis repressor PhaR